LEWAKIRTTHPEEENKGYEGEERRKLKKNQRLGQNSVGGTRRSRKPSKGPENLGGKEKG